MTEDGPYEILPYGEISELKNQIKDLKDAKIAKADVLADSMDRLSKNIDNFVGLFNTAFKELKEDGAVDKDMKEFSDRISVLEDQNKTIAEAILSVADMVKDVKQKVDRIIALQDKAKFQQPGPISPQPERQFQQPPMGPPQPSFVQMNAPPRMPTPSFSDSAISDDLGSLDDKGKKGIFGMKR